MHKTFAYLPRKFFSIITAICAISLLLGCAKDQKETAAPVQESFEFTSTSTFTSILSLPTLTPTLTSQSFLLTPSLTPIPLDPTHWTHFTSPIEVLQSDVQHIAQSKDGTMWFAGLKIYQYNGKNWLIFDQKTITAFRGKVITALATAPDGSVWFGTYMNEIVSFDGSTWKSQIVEEGGYRENRIDSIVIRKNGELCAISIEGMSCQSGGKWIRYPIVVEKTEDKVYVWDAALTPSDEIWVPLSNGILYHYDGKDWKSTKVSRWINSIAASRDGSLWIFDDNGLGEGNDGFGNMDKQGNIVYRTIPDIIQEYHPFVMKEAKDGTVWFGTLGGYQIAQYINGEFVAVDGEILTNSIDQNEQISNENYPFYLAHCIFQAQDGSIWFGTVRGIFQYK